MSLYLPHQATNVLVLQANRLLLHESPEQRVRGQHAAEEQKGIRVKRRSASNDCPRLAQALGHGGAIVVRIEEHGHRFVREDEHDGVQEAYTVHRLNVPWRAVRAEQPAQVLVQREGSTPVICGARARD